MKKKCCWNMKKQFLALTVLPTIGLGLLVTLISYSAFRSSLLSQVENELRNAGNSVLHYFDLSYPGDYSLVSDSADTGSSYTLFKGDSDITEEYRYIDSVKESTGIDITVFYQDVRMLTTIKTQTKKRYSGTTVLSSIFTDIMNTGEEHFYQKLNVLNTPFFAYYAPIRNSDGEIVGIIFAGKPTSEIDSMIRHSMFPIVMIVIFISLIVGALSIFCCHQMVFAVQTTNRFLSRVAQGNLNTELDSRILKKKDELGDMGRCAVNMQQSLRALVEQDALTGLNNRRYADKRLHQLISENHSKDTSFTIAIGDIDFFKKVNDTYGHEAGDVVLKGVAGLIKKCVDQCGYASRWGGEEFLFVFEKISYKQSVKALHAFLDELRNTTFMYNETPIRVTMTIGVAVCHPNDNLNILLKYADDKLYKGKTEGRNQIVT